MNSKQAFEYCRDNKKRVPEYEPIIARSAKYSYLYARFVVQGRFELGEKKIFKNIEYCCRYATTVIKGKLPEEGHNRMIALAMVEESMWTKMYFLGLEVLKVFKKVERVCDCTGEDAEIMYREIFVWPQEEERWERMKSQM